MARAAHTGVVIPAEIAGAVDGYGAALERVAPGQTAALYAVGGVALGDFSARQSNIDLVVVCEPALAEAQRQNLRRAEHSLERVGRPAGIWYTTWAEIADGPGPTRSPADPIPPLETPMTRALLRGDAVAITGPDWPVVAYDEGAFRAWCLARLEALGQASGGLLVMRRAVTPLVLEAARVAQGALTGRVYSKSEAGELSTAIVPAHFRRILTDAIGYRAGARTSMYWGPFERKYDARALVRNLAEAASRAT
jgi:hypothetical protein